MTMPAQVHIPEDELIQYAMGSLSDAQLNNITAHLSLCSKCRAELANTSTTLAAWSGSLPLQDLPAGARDRFQQALRRDEDAPLQRIKRKRRKSILYGRMAEFKEWLIAPRTLQIVSVLMTVAFILVGYDDIQHAHEANMLLGQTQRFQAEAAKASEIESFLQGSDAVSTVLYTKPRSLREPIGHALYSARMRKLIFRVENMPMPPAGKTYQLWILQASGAPPVSAGTFIPNQTGSGAIILPELPNNINAYGFAVTTEDPPGASAPTSTPVLAGN